MSLAHQPESWTCGEPWGRFPGPRHELTFCSCRAKAPSPLSVSTVTRPILRPKSRHVQSGGTRPDHCAGRSLDGSCVPWQAPNRLQGRRRRRLVLRGAPGDRCEGRVDDSLTDERCYPKICSRAGAPLPLPLKNTTPVQRALRPGVVESGSRRSQCGSGLANGIPTSPCGAGVSVAPGWCRGMKRPRRSPTTCWVQPRCRCGDKLVVCTNQHLVLILNRFARSTAQTGVSMLARCPATPRGPSDSPRVIGGWAVILEETLLTVNTVMSQEAMDGSTSAARYANRKSRG